MKKERKVILLRVDDSYDFEEILDASKACIVSDETFNDLVKAVSYFNYQRPHSGNDKLFKIVEVFDRDNEKEFKITAQYLLDNHKIYLDELKAKTEKQEKEKAKRDLARKEREIQKAKKLLEKEGLLNG